MGISVFLKTARTNKNGENDVFLRVSHKGKRFLVATGLSSSGKLNGTSFPRREHNGREKKNRLDYLIREAEGVVLANPDVSANEMKALVDEKISGKPRPEKLLTTAIHLFSKTKRGRTAGLYEGTARKVEAFDGKVSLDEVGTKWLRNFEDFCSKTMKRNSIAIHLRNIRAVFNWAIEEDMTDNYPFKKFRIRHEKTAKRSLSVEELRLLRDYPCEDFQRPYRDIFVLMFYLMGINAKDLLHLTKNNLKRGRIEYRRAKTGKLYSIKVEPEALAIIKRYKGEKWLINPLDRVGNYLNWLHRFNDALKSIGKTYRDGCKPTGEALFPDLSSYWSRHTWGTLAAEIDTPIDVIAHALGHNIPGLDVTSIYIRFNEKKIDEANRAVIDFVNSK